MIASFTQIREVMANILQVPPTVITPETSQTNLSNWDSVEHLNLMLALEQEFGFLLDVDDLQNLTSVQAILDHLETV